MEPFFLFLEIALSWDQCDSTAGSAFASSQPEFYPGIP